VRKTASADRLAEMGDGLRVAEKILEAHGLSIARMGESESAGLSSTG
jgi:hypothetical protein